MGFRIRAIPQYRCWKSTGSRCRDRSQWIHRLSRGVYINPFPRISVSADRRTATNNAARCSLCVCRRDVRLDGLSFLLALQMERNMVTLTERLLKESPSRELDAEIAKAIGLSWGSVVPRTHPMCPRFTTSIDAALTVARSDDERLRHRPTGQTARAPGRTRRG